MDDDRLSVAAIVEEAIAATGIDDIGDDWFLRPLAAWADDLRNDNLTDTGRAFLRRLAVSDVRRRLEVFETIRQHPEILDVEVPPIVYITGLERSGTTILHNLLAQHGSLRPLLRWELMRPVPPPSAETYASDPRIADVQASIEPLRGSLLEQMHWVNADEPEECVWGFVDAIGMLGQAPMFCMPSWREFLFSQDPTPAFAHYRQVVQLLTWRNPVPAGGRLVLKAPQISRDIDRFAAVFPEAQFVVTDRDPFRALCSMLVMGASLMEPFCVRNPVGDPDDVDLVAGAGERLAGLARFGDEHPDRVVHVPYPSLASDPSGTAAALAAQLGLPSDPGFEPAMEEFLEAQRSGHRSAPPKQLDTMGLDHDRVWSVPGIAAYCARFAVEPERRRLTGTG